MKRNLLVSSLAVLCMGGASVLNVVSQSINVADSAVRKCAVSGSVVDETGKPIAGAAIISPNGFLHQRWPSTVTSQNGKFTLENLECGSNTINATRPSPSGAKAVSPLEAVFADAGKTVEVLLTKNEPPLAVQIQLDRASAVFAGSVIDAVTGQPVSNAYVTLRRVDDPKRYLVVNVPQDGRFTVEVPSAPFTAVVTGAGYEPVEFSGANMLHLRADSRSDVEVRLKKK